MSNHKLFRILHWNCNSIKKKNRFLESFLAKNDIDIISLNEIKCNLNRANDKLNIPSYKLYHKSRTDFGGGAALLIKDKYSCNSIDLPIKFETDECVGLEIKINNKAFQIFSYYAPSNLLNSDLINWIINNYDNYVIIGDLNAITNWQDINKVNANGLKLDEILFNSDCQILNSSKDHTFNRLVYQNGCQTHLSSLLDLALGPSTVANLTHNYEVLKTTELTSDHHPILLTIKTQTIRLSEQKQNNKPFMRYDLANWAIFHNKLAPIRSEPNQ